MLQYYIILHYQVAVTIRRSRKHEIAAAASTEFPNATMDATGPFIGEESAATR
jgi:hypothetical protein